MDDLKSQIETIKSDIERSSDNWLFPSKGNVQGFMGTGKVMFIGERPSTGTFGRKPDRLLYDILEKYNLEDSHLTDLIKSRGKVGEDYPQKEILKKEIEVIKPRLIFSLGHRVQNYLLFGLAEFEIDTIKIYHYAYAARYKKEKEFEQQIKDGLIKYHLLSNANFSVGD